MKRTREKILECLIIPYGLLLSLPRCAKMPRQFFEMLWIAIYNCFLFSNPLFRQALSNVELTGCVIAYLWPQIAKTRHILPKFHSVLCSSFLFGNFGEAICRNSWVNTSRHVVALSPPFFLKEERKLLFSAVCVHLNSMGTHTRGH